MSERGCRAAPRALLFDLDGTLIDSLELILSSYRHTLEVHGSSAVPDETFLVDLGRPLRTVFAEHAGDADEVEAMVTTYRTHNARVHESLLREFPGVHEAIGALAARGVPLAIVTSKGREAALRGLDTCRLRPYFEVVVSADDVDDHKPHPRPVERGLELLGAKAEEALFVGDSPHDMEAGRRAGVETAAVLWGPFPRERLAAHAPTRWLGAPAELADLA